MREAGDYVGKPIRSLQTMLRVLSKTRDNQPAVIPDGRYGADTVRAVSAFQRQQGLPVTGAADIGTWNRVADAYAHESPLVLPAAPLEIVWQPRDVIRPGEENLHLYVIQGMLKAIREKYPEMPELEVSGVHDGPSVAAIKWMQGKCGRPETGTVDQIDWLYLTKLYRMTAGGGRQTRDRT